MNLVFRKLCSIASPGNEFKSGTVDKTVWTIEDRGTAVGDMVGWKMRSCMMPKEVTGGYAPLQGITEGHCTYLDI